MFSMLNGLLNLAVLILNTVFGIFDGIGILDGLNLLNGIGLPLNLFN
jgi:hypothetical protein